MKQFAFATLVILSSISAAQSSDKTLYIHAFRAPSTGLEYRAGNFGLHAGLYTTILGSGEKSTEFLKVGGTYYYRLSSKPEFSRFESYFSGAFVRGINRDYEDKNGAFFESGFLYDMGKGFQFRLGTGLLVADGFRAKVNPTVGISYSIPLR